jgi:1-deoxy-D-xylulose-5-phosphate synthase
MPAGRSGRSGDGGRRTLIAGRCDLLADLVRRIPRVVTVEENMRQGGFGSAVLEALNDAGIHHVSIERLGIPDVFVEHGPQSVLRAKYGLDAKAIANAALHLLHWNDVPCISARGQRA